MLPPHPTFPRRFDLLIIDEAHNVAPTVGKYAVESLRTRLVRLLAPHYQHKLFLTATPHDGYTESFTALLELLDDQRFSRNLLPPEEQLARVMFPVGELKKTEVRRIAREAGIAVHDKKDSTGICFIGERPFREFLNRYLPRAPGPMVDENGHTVGEHIGLAFYTIGQRKASASEARENPGMSRRKTSATRSSLRERPWKQKRQDRSPCSATRPRCIGSSSSAASCPMS